MGRHKTKEEWKYWFKKYESGTLVWSEYLETTTVRDVNDGKRSFRKKYEKYKELGDIIITSMTGKMTRPNKGRPKKN